MAKVYRLSTRIITYLPSLRSAGQRAGSLRGLSPAICGVSSTEPTVCKSKANSGDTTSNTNEFPLPGCILPVACQLLGVATSSTQHQSAEEVSPPLVEVSVAECPATSQSYFLDLFSNVHLEGELCIATLSERTEKDMSTWSWQVEEEREELTKHFIKMASKVCVQLLGEGYWADFIDPASGRAFYSPHSNNILLETDAKFTTLGFEIVDLGCCKAISHPQWGTHTFVGTIFTDAPSETLAATVTALAPS